MVWRSSRVAQQPQPLHRVDRVHRHLERQVHVVLLEQHQRLADEHLALLQRERARSAEERRQVLGGREVIADRFRFRHVSQQYVRHVSLHVRCPFTAKRGADAFLIPTR